ncbi:zona pellucida protein AX 4 [Scleropages formosus]|uniref:zona pellucida protein AX 4 n=1 Tax=Scleropages formosus TaxID=113540 RepID=UPI0010FAC051|nr:uncharacterized protein LOC108918733 [Scleropages formosus]
MFSSVLAVVLIKMLSILLLCVLSVCVPSKGPVGMFRTECRDGHFWLTVGSGFLGRMFRFDTEGRSGVHTVSDQRAAICGYTMLLDSWGNLVLRASYLACDVDTREHTGIQLMVWFVNKEANDEETSYPFLLTCPLQQWSPREIMCEENYMEVSVKKPIPPVVQKGQEWMTPPPKRSEQGGMKEWRVVFRIPPGAQEDMMSTPVREQTLTLMEAEQLGYHINFTGSRILLRCGYSSPFSYVLKVKGIDLEVISITIFYRYQWTLFKVDASVACSLYKGTMDGTYILWSIPQILPPLVQGPVRNQGARMGVGGRLLSACLIQQRGYKMEVRDGVVEVRIPFGAVGGQIKSHVMAGRYSQSYSVDLFYVQQWGDAQWTLTRHRSFRPLWTTPSPHSPRLVNLTVPEEGDFSVTLGVFPPDVSLANVTIATLTVPLAGAEELGLRVTQVPFPNGTHAYLLQVPFPHPLVSQKYLGGKYRRYTLAVTFTLLISPHREVFTHSASVVCDLQDVVLPRVEGRCTDKTMKLTLHRGNMDTQWAIFFGNHRLEPDLVEFGGYSLEAADDYFTVEVPLYSLGMAYEDLSLQGLLANVAVSVLDVETGAVEQTFIQRCTFHVRELMVCLPNSWMVVVVDTARVVPPLDPRDIALLDPSCRPKEMDRTRALFSFSLDSCGTIQGVEGKDLVYVNEVRYMPRYLPIPQPFFHPFYYYRQPLGCRYPLNGTRTLAIYQSRLWPLSRTRPSQHNPFVRAERG